MLVAAFMVVGFVTGGSASSVTDIYTSYYAFGDSLTDDGKFGMLAPPSLGGRFSNGPTYTEHIADQFIAAGLDTGNLALGGATGGPVNLNPAGPLSTFGGQIATFTNTLANGVGLPTSADFSTTKPTAPAPGTNPLVSVLFGPMTSFSGSIRSKLPIRWPTASVLLLRFRTRPSTISWS